MQAGSGSEESVKAKVRSLCMWLTGCMKGHLMQVVHLLLHVQGSGCTLLTPCHPQASSELRIWCARVWLGSQTKAL